MNDQPIISIDIVAFFLGLYNLCEYYRLRFQTQNATTLSLQKNKTTKKSNVVSSCFDDDLRCYFINKKGNILTIFFRFVPQI